jgi:hypothetical protein
MVRVILLGDGMRLFEGGTARMRLTLVETRPIDTGVVMPRYARDREA